MQVFIGCFAFLLFAVGDLNDWKLGRSYLKFCFPMGAFLLAMATAFEMTFKGQLLRPVFLVPAVIFLGLLIYTLFFDFSSRDAYVSQDKGRAVYTGGTYSICRHPGVLWFIGLYLSLSFSGLMGYTSTAVYCVLNILLVIFEDIYVFPDTLKGYDEYKSKVPFLVPGFYGLTGKKK